jgi:hypothetical protein
MEGLIMKWNTLDYVWKMAGRPKNLKVRFQDWSYQTKYFTLMGESEDGKRFIGKLDNGEKISYSKKSKGWALYHSGDEHHAQAV